MTPRCAYRVLPQRPRAPSRTLERPWTEQRLGVQLSEAIEDVVLKGPKTAAPDPVHVIVDALRSEPLRLAREIEKQVHVGAQALYVPLMQPPVDRRR